jgi:hypothetical protein
MSLLLHIHFKIETGDKQRENSALDQSLIQLEVDDLKI